MPEIKAIKLEEDDWKGRHKAGYDLVAEEYARQYRDELNHKPFDCTVLDRLATSLPAGGKVCDVGCGPGHVGGYLKQHGFDVCGLDLSPQMVTVARHLNPDMLFEAADMLDLPFANESLAAILSFYAVIHIRRDNIPRALAEFYRVLQPSGKLLIAFHGGDGEIHRDEWYGKTVSIDATLFQPDEMREYAARTGFVVDEMLTRDPYDFEYPTQRVYMFATKQHK
jgi:SAM-dependent methyltransferase